MHFVHEHIHYARVCMCVFSFFSKSLSALLKFNDLVDGVTLISGLQMHYHCNDKQKPLNAFTQHAQTSTWARMAEINATIKRPTEIIVDGTFSKSF